MSVDYSLLKTIHRILRQKSDLSGRIERGPKQIASAENAERQFVEELELAKANLTKIQMLADEKQLLLSQREAKIEDSKGKLNAANSNKEFQLLKDQIAADEQANSVLSDEIFELLERLDGLSDELEQAKGNLEKGRQETEKVRQRIETETASLQGELDSVLAELAENETKLTGDYAAEYRRLVAVRGEDALAETDMQTCGNCYTKITTQKMNELLLKKPVFCQSCGSLMYATEPSASVS